MGVPQPFNSYKLKEFPCAIYLDVREYCDQLGLDPDKESDLLYIAKEAIKAPLPPEWKPW